MTESTQQEFLELFEPVREGLSRFARAMARNRDDAHDIVAEAVLQAYENFHKLKKKESFKSYIFTIASRIYKRKRWRERIFGNYDEKMAEDIVARETSADTKLDIQLLYDTLKKLPEKQREAIILFEISGFSLDEICEQQGGTLSGVKSRLKRGREKLKELMNSDLRDEIIPQNNSIHRKTNELDYINGTGLHIEQIKNEVILKARK